MRTSAATAALDPGAPSTRARSSPVVEFASRRWWLISTCVGAAVTEALLLLFLAPRSSAALAPQVSAPAPLGAFHDIRWLAVYHSSWWTFGAELVALVVFRTLLDTIIVRQAWPAGLPRPGLRTTVLRILPFTAVVVVLLVPWTALLFGLAVAPISWLLITALPPVVVVASLIHHGAATSDWWRRLPSMASVGWILASFLTMSVIGGLIDSGHGAEVVALAAVGGAWNAVAWAGLVRAVVCDARPRRVPLVAPLVAMSLVGLVLGGAAAGFGAQTGTGRPVTRASGDPSGPPVLVVAGFSTHWGGTSPPPRLGDFRTRWFSYRGIDRRGDPLPYGASDTYQSLATSEHKLATQVLSLHRENGQPVGVVAVSEGTIVAKAYLASTPSAPVGQLVLVSPVADPGRVYYPPPGDAGWGAASGWALALLADGMGAVSPINISPSTPLLRSIVNRGPALRRALSQPLPGVHESAVLPLADAVATPDDINFGGPAVVVPAFHNGSLGDAGIRAIVTELLDGQTVTTGPWSAAETILHRGAAPWQVPSLDPTVNAAWAPVPA